MSINSETKQVIGSFDFPRECNETTYSFILSEFKKWLNANACEYYFIVHDKDIKADGDLKHKHLHFCFRSNDKKHRLSYYLNNISKVCNIESFTIDIDIWKNYEGGIQYLIHKNDLDKYQYNVDSIITNMSIDTLMIIINREIVESVDIDYLIFVVKECNGNLPLVYKRLGLDISKQYRYIITDLINCYLRDNL